MPKGSYDNTRDSKKAKGSGKVLYAFPFGGSYFGKKFPRFHTKILVCRLFQAIFY